MNFEKLVGWIAERVASATDQRPWRLAASLVLVTLSAIAILASRHNFDSEVLNLLPADSPAVEGLKVMNSRFSQARAVTFVVVGPDEETTTELHDDVAEALRGSPWVVRVLDGPPLESDTGREDLARLLVPLLLNLPPEALDSALAGLESDSLRERVARFRRGIDAGAPGALVEISSDPLGLLAAAVLPIAEAASLEQTFDLVSPDGRTRVIQVVTNQADLSAAECQAMMRTVHAFREAMLAEVPEGVDLTVTGRSAYVDEISASMRRDIQVTSIVSLLAVSGLFWFAFRRILPLIGLALLLSISALVSLVIGAVWFSQLNVIAIGFCSILFGVGDDFGLLLIERFRRERAAGREFVVAVRNAIQTLLPGIVWVALTTCIGFLALSLSGSVGFSQLGMLVSIGVFACAAAVVVYLFLFVRKAGPPMREGRWSDTLSDGLRQRARAITVVSAVVLFGLGAYAIAPLNPLRFDTDPSSMEPRDIPAARALATIMDAFPAAFEPVFVVGTFDSIEDSVTANHALLDRVAALSEREEIEGYASPAPLLPHWDRMRANAARLDAGFLRNARAEWAAALDDVGLRADGLPVANAQWDALIAAANNPGDAAADWSAVLPESSPWWFLWDRMIADDGLATLSIIKVRPNSTDVSTALELDSLLRADDPVWMVTGWTQTLESLVPWAERELVTFGSAVVLVILVVLWFVYRDGWLWFAHALGLALALAATVATLKLTGQKINLLNVLAFPLLLAVGVDYGIHLLLALRQEPGVLASIIKPVFISGLSTAAGFGALALAKNPSLSGLGIVCSVGVLWALIVSLVFVLPLAALRRREHR